jgi:hypothetical protein
VRLTSDDTVDEMVQTCTGVCQTIQQHNAAWPSSGREKLSTLVFRLLSNFNVSPGADVKVQPWTTACSH